MEDPQHSPTGLERNPTYSRLLIVAATLLWSTSGFFAKAPVLKFWHDDIRGIQLAFWRVAFALLLLVPCIRKVTWTWRLLPAGITFASMNVCFLKAMTTTSAANAIWLQYTAPAIVLLVGVWFLGEKIVAGDYVMLALCLLGVGCILWFEFSLAARQGHGMEGVFWSLASGATFAGVILSIRALRDVDSAWVVTVCHLSAAVILLPVIIRQSVVPPLPLIGWMAAFGILQLGLPYLLFAKGTRVIAGHEAAFIGLLEPIFVPLWAYLCWGNVPASWTIIGGSFILAGLFFRYGRG